MPTKTPDQQYTNVADVGPLLSQRFATILAGDWVVLLISICGAGRAPVVAPGRDRPNGPVKIPLLLPLSLHQRAGIMTASQEEATNNNRGYVAACRHRALQQEAYYITDSLGDWRWPR